MKKTKAVLLLIYFALPCFAQIERALDCDRPIFEEKHLVEDSVKYPVSVNGKKRDLIEVPAGSPKEEVEKLALGLESMQKWLEGKTTVRRVIVVPGRMVNIVVS